MKTRCKKCRWIHEADSTAGTSFHGVGLCDEHAAASELRAALECAEATIQRLAPDGSRATQGTRDVISAALHSGQRNQPPPLEPVPVILQHGQTYAIGQPAPGRYDRPRDSFVMPSGELIHRIDTPFIGHPQP